MSWIETLLKEKWRMVEVTQSRKLKLLLHPEIERQLALEIYNRCTAHPNQRQYHIITRKKSRKRWFADMEIIPFNQYGWRIEAK